MPLALIGFHFVRLINKESAQLWLIIVSLVFYGWWRPINLLIIIPSIVTNFVLAKLMLKHIDDRKKAGFLKTLLAVGIVANLMFLGYFKYLTFFQASSNQLFGQN